MTTSIARTQIHDGMNWVNGMESVVADCKHHQIQVVIHCCPLKRHFAKHVGTMSIQRYTKKTKAKHWKFEKYFRNVKHFDHTCAAVTTSDSKHNQQKIHTFHSDTHSACYWIIDEIFDFILVHCGNQQWFRAMVCFVNDSFSKEAPKMTTNKPADDTIDDLTIDENAFLHLKLQRIAGGSVIEYQPTFSPHGE